MFDYRICGLTVASEIELAGAIPALPARGEADVAIRRAAVPKILQNSTAIGPNWQMTSNQFLLCVPDLARFLMTGGRDIALELEADGTELDTVGFVLGSAFGILLHQRGALVLHGAAVARGDRAIAICGISGAGKSTLAAALCSEGYSFATDDLCVVDLDERRRPIVQPDGRRLKLWKQSIDRLELGGRRREAVRGPFEKYYIDQFDSASIPPTLDAIYLLQNADPKRINPIEVLPLPDAMRALEFNCYRPTLRDRMGDKPSMMAHAATVLGHAKAYFLHRPRGFEHLPQTIAGLCAHWESLQASAHS